MPIKLNRAVCLLFTAAAFLWSSAKAQSPTDNAATPTADAADVIAIYSDSYTSIGTNFDPGWGQSGHGQVNPNFDPGTGDLVLAYPNFNYQGTEMPATDASGKAFLHVDVWVAEGTDRLLKVTPVNNGAGGTGAAEFLVNVPLTPGSWNSVDLAKSDFTGMTWDNVFQLKFDGQFNGDGTANTTPYDVYLDNIYFHGTDTGGGGDPATVEVTINVNMENEETSPQGVYIAGGLDFGVPGANAMTDTDGDDIWTITFTLASGYTGNYTITNGACGDWSCKEDISGQDCADGPYNDRLLANITEDTTINTCFGECSTDGTCTTAPPPPPASGPTDNAAAPTQDAANVASVYGDSYTSIATNLNPGWGQMGSVNPAFDPGTGNVVMLYSNLNYQGTDLTASDLSAMNYLHVDVWVEAGTDRLLKVTPVNNLASGGSGAAEFLVNVPLTPGAWNSVDLPKSSFTGMTWDNVFQMKFDGQFNGDGTSNGNGYDVYLDNIYFWKDPAAAISGCMDSNAANYNSAATEDDGTCSYNVTFRVDMSDYTGSFGVVNINGSFNNWCGGCNPLSDADLDGVWEVTLPLLTGTIEYKFTLDGWTAQEEFTSGAPCTSTLGGFTNRTLTITGTEVLDAVCYNSCSACAVVPGCMDTNAVNYDSAAEADDGSCLYAVTFQVDMSQYGLAAGDIVYTNGAYNSWCGDCNPMADADGDGIWTGTFNLPAGQQEYKFTVNGWNVSEQFDGSESCTTAPAEYVNRVASISDATTLPAVCWNSCDICYDINNTTAGTGHTTIQDAIDAATAGDVISLAAGTFSPTGTVTVDKSLTIAGAGSASTTIDVGGYNAWGIYITADDVTLSGVTIQGDAVANQQFALKAGSGNNTGGTPSICQNLTYSDIVIQGTKRTAIDLNGVNGATLTDITATGATSGFGMSISSSANVTVTNLTTSGNAWGDVGIFPANSPYQWPSLEGPTGITFGGTIDLSSGTGSISVQDGSLQSGGTWVGTISNDAADNADVTVPASFSHVVNSTRDGDGLVLHNVGPQAAIHATAQALAGSGAFSGTTIDDLDNGDIEVVEGLSIQDAIDAASAGDVISLADGTYAIETPILVDKAVTLQGQSEAGVVLECGAGLGGANSIQVTAGATLKDFTLNANSNATFGIHVHSGAANATLSGLTITNTASNGIGLSGVTDATVSDIAGSVGVTASDISGGNVGVYKGTGTYAQTATDITFTGTFDLAGGFIIEQLDGADEITYSIDGSAADVKIPASFDRVFFADYTNVPLPPPYNEASLATLVEADNLATAIATAQALDAYGYGLQDAAVYNLTAAQWEVSAGLSIQDAIDRAATGGVISLAAGTYEEDLALNKGVTINGPNAGIAHDGARGAEAVIDGEHTLSAAAALTLDGLQFLSNNPAQTSTIYVSTAAGHAIQNNRFVSSIAGGNTGGNHDLAIYTAVLSTGTMTITGNSFSGDGSFTDGDRYSTAAWGRGIWLNGGGAAVTIAGNAFTNCRTGMNLENYDNSACSVDGNHFTDCGSGISMGDPTASTVTTITANTFEDVDTDINARNLTTALTWDLGATGNGAVPGNSTVYSDLGYIPGNSAGDIDDPNGNLLFLSGNGADNLTFGADDNTVTGDFTAGADDVMDGGAGTDVAQYGDNLADLTITASGNVVTVSSPTAGTDQLTNFEVIRGADGDLAFALGCTDADACNYTEGSTLDDGSCTYPPAAYFSCDGDCINDADGDGICDELEGLIPELETACGHGTVWDAALGQCVMDVGCIGDVDLDGAVTATDLLYMLGNFGSYCPGFGPDGGE